VGQDFSINVFQHKKSKGYAFHMTDENGFCGGQGREQEDGYVQRTQAWRTIETNLGSFPGEARNPWISGFWRQPGH